MSTLISDPENRWTPFRWLRYKLTGDPLKDYERQQLEMFKRTWDDVNDIPHGPSHLRITMKYSYWGKLDRKYRDTE